MLHGYESTFHQASKLIYCTTWTARKKGLYTCEVVYVVHSSTHPPNTSKTTLIFNNPLIRELTVTLHLKLLTLFIQEGVVITPPQHTSISNNYS